MKTTTRCTALHTVLLATLVLTPRPSRADEPKPLTEPVDGIAGRDNLVRQVLATLHEGLFEEALRTSARLRDLYPQDPAGALGAANVYQTMMRDFRVRTFEREFGAMLAEAQTLSSRSFEQRPSSEAAFARGTARLYQAVHRFTRGERAGAFLDAVAGMRDMRRAAEQDATSVDPLLAMAVHDYWKAEHLGLGIGLFSGGRKLAVERLQIVQARGRFLRVEASYALEMIHLKEGRFASALALNDTLLAQFPDNPVALYHRALSLEGLLRRDDALDVWDRLVARLHAFPHQSDGFLAECHLRRAQLFQATGQIAESRAALARATGHICRRDAAKEMEGPLVRTESIRKSVIQLARTQASPLTCGGPVQ